LSNATVFVIDDDPGLRRALAQLFETEQLAVCTFESAQAFLEAYDPRCPGCLLVDVRMPEMSGLELQRQLEERNIELPVVFMTAYADVKTSVRAMKGGAVDFVEKPFNEQALLEAIHGALAKNRKERASHDVLAEAQARVATLTERERQVLEQVIRGKTSRDIAEAWGISEKTIKVHRGRVMEKMGAESIPHLVVLAQQAGLHTT
jgi:two-component system response regulator FixJ